MHISSKWSISVRFPHQNSASISPLAHTCHMSKPSHPTMKPSASVLPLMTKTTCSPYQTRTKNYRYQTARQTILDRTVASIPWIQSALHERNFDLLVSFTKTAVASSLPWLCPDMNITFFTVSASILTSFLATAVSFFVLFIILSNKLP
jgi:hypothetical protein